MLFWIGGAWQASELSRDFIASIDAGRRRMGVNDQEFAHCLGVTPTRIVAMRAGLDGGPAIGRFCALPLAFWLGFAMDWFPRWGLRVIEDTQIDKLIACMNIFMVNAMKRDMARMYSGELLPEDCPEDERKSA